MNREELIAGLETKYRDFTDALYEELRTREFPFKEQQAAHLEYLDKKLIVRHALPYCITEDAFFGLDAQSVKFLASVLLLHSLALTRMDDYYDGGSHTKSVRELNIHMLAYSLSATHESLMSLLGQSPDARELVKLLNVTKFVHARMYKDYTERYKTEFLERPHARLAAYVHSPKSRLLGSGYWEVMARASFVQRGEAFPGYLHLVDIDLRKFRQLIDELADIDEDLRGGLITLPVLHVLSTHKQSSIIKKRVIDYWSSDMTAELPELALYLEESKTKEWIYVQAMSLYDDAMKRLDSKLSRRNKEYKQLFDFKRAKLESLVV